MQVASGKFVLQRFNAKVFEQLVLVGVITWLAQYAAKSSRVVQTQDFAVVELYVHMIVLQRRRTRIEHA
jgi:hypothetical protein